MNKSVYDDMEASEKEVAAYLRHLEIFWSYEQPVFVLDEKKRPRVWTPDFYLPELGLYIEVCGSKKFDYKYREEIYRMNMIPIIFIHKYKYPSQWQTYLLKKVNEIHEERSKIIKGCNGI